jgi:hypothetical protein
MFMGMVMGVVGFDVGLRGRQMSEVGERWAPEVGRAAVPSGGLAPVG